MNEVTVPYSLTCQNCNEVISSEAEYFISESFEANCSETGRVIYYIDVIYNDCVYTTSRIVKLPINPDVHNYVDNVCGYCGAVDYSNLSFVAFGDSITYGADLIIGGRVETPYPTEVNNILGFKSYSNLGVSGATVAANTQGLNCMTDEITSYTGEADIIAILGGVNDYNRDLPLGDIDDRDTSTIYGALHVSMSYLAENYSDSYIFYMTPYKQDFHGKVWNVDNSQGYSLIDVANAIKEVAAIYGFDVLDLLEEGNFESIMNNEDCDGVHPNQEFILNVMAPQIAQFIQDNYN